MSRRRRRVKIKSSSRLFAAFILLFNCLLLLTTTVCVKAHYQEQSQLQQNFEQHHQQQHHQANPYLSALLSASASTAGKSEQSFDSSALFSRVSSQLQQRQQQHYQLNHQKFTFQPQQQQQQQQQQEEPQRLATAASSIKPIQARVSPSQLPVNDPTRQEHLDGESSSAVATQEENGGSGTAGSSHLDRNQNNDDNYEQNPYEDSQQAFDQQQQQQQQQQQPETSNIPSISSLCAMLPVASSRHLKLCKLIGHSPGADEAVAMGASRALSECKHQFKSERWNCTHASGEHHLLTSKFAQSVGNRESAYVQAIVAAGIVHSIATACSDGSLSDCACDKSRVGLIRQKDQIWKWGGCSNNIRHGMTYARHLIELLDAIHEQHHQQHHHQMQRSLSVGGNSNQRRLHHHPHHHLHQHHRYPASSSASVKSQHKRNLSKRQISGLDDDRVIQVSPGAATTTNSNNNFCQKNQNISQATHLQLIKSLLAKNSLERHQDFRLAMNMHNNKVGRMAIAKNMEIKCRCHGLSGSCSLKTCWLKLPDFQQVGAYLKRKYEASVHLPSVINVNKLIPMMDRNEISAILASSASSSSSSSSLSQAQQVSELRRARDESHARLAAVSSSGSEAAAAVAAASAPSENSLAAAISSAGGQAASAALGGARPLPEYAALSSAPQTLLNSPGDSPVLAGHPLQLTTTRPIDDFTQQQQRTLARIDGMLAPLPAHFKYYEQHRQQLEQQRQTTAQINSGNLNNNGTSFYLHAGEEPVQVAPMSQQQFQSLLRDTRLCNTTTTAASTITSTLTHFNSHVSTRDLHNMDGGGGGVNLRKLTQVSGKQQQQRKSMPASNSIRSVEQDQKSAGFAHAGLLSAAATTASQQQQQQQLKSTSQHLGHLLAGNARDDLIHLHRSPAYCEADLRHGFAGVQGRLCSNETRAPDSCDKLCCGRGFETREIQLRYNCDCKFRYCCEIHCNTCESKKIEFVCK